MRARVLSRFFLVSTLVSGVAGCATEHGAGMDASPDGAVFHGCYLPSVPYDGAPCDFVERCVTSWDFYMGYCGMETWSCVEGRVQYSDMRFRCSPPDVGIRVDAGNDGGGGGAYCPDYVAPPAATSTECRSDADCTGGTCWRPGDTGPNDASGFCTHDCTDDAACGPGSVCDQYNGGFCARCEPACTPTSCGAYEACGDDGHCTPARCETGDYVCPPGSVCVMGEVDAHGCLDVPCLSDADCGCGACVGGNCASGPGRCDLARP